MKKLLILFSLCGCYFLQAQTLTPAQVQTFKAQVQAKNQSIQTMQTDFLQRKHSDFMTKDIESFGKMAFAKPAKLNWQYTQPYSHRILFQNDAIYINDEGHISEIKNDNKIFNKINQLIINSVSGNMFDNKEFDVKLYLSGNKTLAKLFPKDKTLLKYTKEIHLLFAPDSTVDNVKLLEPSGDYTEIIFKNKVINGKIDSSAFQI